MSDFIAISPDVMERIDGLCERFESSWRGGQPSLEEFLVDAPESERTLWLRGLLEIEIEVLRTRGQAVDVESYLARFPGQIAAVRAAFDPSSRLFGIEVRQAERETVIPSSGTDQPRSGLATPKLHHQFGRYEIRRELGAGAMGTVYLAHDPQLQRLVALKVPRPDHIATEGGKARFLREARAAAALHHRNLCPVFDVGETDGLPYITMAYLAGGTLSGWVGRNLSASEIAKLVRKIALALDHAHLQGVVHRDLKPSNIIFDVEQEPVVTDFGLARLDAMRDASMTISGRFDGTPNYMSPEQAMGQGHQGDSRMDVYSIGVILFQLLTGEVPFRGEPHMVMQQVIHDEPPLPRRLNHLVPRDLETVCLKCLGKEPQRRYASAGELAADLQRYLDGQPILARPVGRMERAWRWCKRSPVVAGLALGLAVALIVGTATSTTFAFQAGSEAREARASNEQLTDFISTMRLVSAIHNPIDLDSFRTRPKPVESPELKARLKKTSERMHGPENQPESRAELLDAMGTICRGIGEYDLALVYLDQAILIRRKLGAPVKRGLADSLMQYGWLKHETGKYSESEAALREALTLDDGRQADKRFFAVAEFHLAWIIADRGSKEDPKLLKESLERFQAVAERIKQISGDESKDYAVALLGVAIAYFANGNDKAALNAMQLSQARFQSKASESLDPASQVVTLYLNATIVRGQGKLAGAEKNFRQAIELADQIVGEQHPFIKLPVAFLKADFAGLLRDMKKDAEAEKVARQALGVIRNSPVRGHLEVIRAMIQFADRLRARGHDKDFQDAVGLYSDSVQFGTVSLGPDHQFVQDAKAKLESLRKELQVKKDSSSK